MKGLLRLLGGIRERAPRIAAFVTPGWLVAFAEAAAGGVVVSASWLWLVDGVLPPNSAIIALFVQAVALSAALLHAHRRWQRSHREETKSWPYHVPRATAPAFFVFWSALAALSWWTLIHIGGETILGYLKAFRHGNASDYVTAVGVLVAMVTGFYLVMLNRTLDTAQKQVEKLERIDQFEREVDHRIASWPDMVRTNIKVRTDTLAEILIYLDELWPKGRKNHAAVSQRLAEMRRGLQAESALLSLWSAEDCEAFLLRWRDVDPYLGLIEERPQQFVPLTPPARRRLEALCNGDPSCCNDARAVLRELKRLEGLSSLRKE